MPRSLHHACLAICLKTAYGRQEMCAARRENQQTKTTYWWLFRIIGRLCRYTYVFCPLREVQQYAGCILPEVSSDVKKVDC
ncbi:hypothetical protein F5Y17DRAFT_443108 [Xylariaceae sp. FL0594]|nr:hypothetical protein F5Y17DRAFT_443108 [Xylariaceae sp. FL0594]